MKHSEWLSNLYTIKNRVISKKYSTRPELVGIKG